MMIQFMRGRSASKVLLTSGAALFAAGGLAGCQAKIDPQGGMMTAGSGSGAGASAGSTSGAADTTSTSSAPDGTTGSGTGTTGSGTGETEFDPTPVADCVGSTVGASKRLVRLTFNQLAASVRSLFGDSLAAQVQTAFEIGSLSDRDFPPLSSPREGSLFIDSVWQSSDAIAQAVGKYVLDNFATVTACTDTPTADCATQYVSSLAERAFRRPLEQREQARLLQVFTEAQAAGGTVQEATQYSVYAIMQSPHYLYRTEFGSAPYTQETLAPYELASALSYFLTDAPPDQGLIQAASSGQLSTQDQMRAQAERLLATPTARENLQAAVFAYFEIPALDSVVIDPTFAPEFTSGLRNSMYRESQLFLDNALWNGPVGDVLTSRTTFVNESLASLYGVAYPPPGSTPDADGFAMTELPDTRAGLLSNAGFLTARSRPDVASVVGRGILVNATILCADIPPVPENLADTIANVSAMLAGASEREKSEYRTSTVPCNGCHSNFDPYGLALDNFDVIGKYRTADSQNRPISAQVTLPDGTVTNTLPELANHVAVSGQFASCMAKHFIDYSLAEVSQDIKTDSCAVKAVMDKFNTTSQTFTDLVREIAASSTMAVRAPGGMQ